MKQGALARIAGGYLEAIRGGLGLLLVIAVSAAASLLITLPLWFFAVRSPKGYSAFIAAAALAAVTASIVLFLGNRDARGGLSVARFLRLRVLPGLLLAVLLLAGIAASFMLLAMRRFLLLGAFLLAFLAVFGWFRYARGRP